LELILLERFSASRFIEQVRRHRATVISVLPTVIRAQLPLDEVPELSR
jgi:hypothetical protein